MNKEQIITIILGLLVGALITGGYFAGSKLWPKFANKQPEVISLVPKAKSKAVENKNQTSGLLIESPKDYDSTTNDTITINGKTAPGNLVVVYSPADEKIASASSNGTFSINIKLEDGDNEIAITSINQTSQIQVTEKLTIVKEIPKE